MTMPAPSFKRVITTDGNAGYLVGAGLTLSLLVAVLYLILRPQPSPLVAGAITLPTIVLGGVGLLWAQAIRMTLANGVAVRGRVVRQTVGMWREAVLVFSYELNGREVVASNRLLSREAAKHLVEREVVEVRIPRSRWPGPILADVYR